VLPILVGLSVLLLFVLVGVVASIRRRADFPPISDAEFMARCRPGTSPEVALKVRRIVADALAVEYDRVHPSTNFVEDIGAD
jgi:hypothetical protein